MIERHKHSTRIASGFQELNMICWIDKSIQINVFLSPYYRVPSLTRMVYRIWLVSRPAGGDPSERRCGFNSSTSDWSQRRHSSVQQAANSWETSWTYRPGARSPGCHWALWPAGGARWTVYGAGRLLPEHGTNTRGSLRCPNVPADTGVEIGLWWAVAKNPRAI